MPGKTFVEKIFGARTGSIVFRSPDIVLTHDNTASIYKTFRKMGGVTFQDPERMLIVLDHNAKIRVESSPEGGASFIMNFPGGKV